MAKNNKKGKRKNARIIPKVVEPVPINPSTQKSYWVKTFKIIGIAGTFLTLCGIFDVYDLLKKSLLTSHDIYEEEVFIKGIKIPEYVLRDKDYLHFRFGSNQLIYRNIKNAVRPFTLNSWIGCDWTDEPINLWFYLDGDRLRVYDTVKSIDNNQTIALLNYDKATLFKPNLLDYYADDESLEIIDRQSQVAFSMSLSEDSIIDLQGYFISNNNIAVMSNSLKWCLSPSSPFAKDTVRQMMGSATRVQRHKNTIFNRPNFWLLFFFLIVFAAISIKSYSIKAENKI